MKLPRLMLVLFCGFVWGAFLGGWIAGKIGRHSMEPLQAQNEDLRAKWEKAETERKAAVEQVAAARHEIEYLRQDSMALAILQERIKTNAPSLQSQPGFFLDTNRAIYLNYSTRDPIVQTFLRSVMTGEGDSMAKGKVIFDKLCAACHQPDGEGKEGLAPPLAGSEWIAAKSGDRLVRMLMNGVTGPIHVRGTNWNLTMPPWRENLDDEQIATILNYVRSKWAGEGAALIKPELAESARGESHPKPETEDELLKIPLP
jgi:mono/diheme cytochrome c family protein/outer membrane murein-binding lipoprotein Lpp